ncbi:hypothetical protein ACFPM0_35015 [Pseudonocardia sulfidoxydans]
MSGSCPRGRRAAARRRPHVVRVVEPDPSPFETGASTDIDVLD